MDKETGWLSWVSPRAATELAELLPTPPAPCAAR